MADRFISSAIQLHETIQQEIFCSIHQGLLTQPITLPCFHRFCDECLEHWINTTPTRTRIRCPNCNIDHILPSNWKTRWLDRAIGAVADTLRSTETEINKKIVHFVEESFYKFGFTNLQLKINKVSQINNSHLKDVFERCKKELNCYDVVTLLHGTDLQSAYSISTQGFRIPTSFLRQSKGAEGELKFGKAIYFAHGRKATEYGENVLVLADCIFGRTLLKTASHLQLTPAVVHKADYHTIYFNNHDEGLVNQEWAIYRVDQCLPLCIIEYEMVDLNAERESALIEKIKKMNFHRPDNAILKEALFGTDNQCKAVLDFLVDACFAAPLQASLITYILLYEIPQEKFVNLFKHQNETIRILFLRALWYTGKHDHRLQVYFHDRLDMNLLLDALHSSYTDVSWRACGVLANMAACVVQVRHFLITNQVLQKLMELLKRSIETQDKICILTVINLLANITCSEHSVMKGIQSIHDFINANLLDHPDKEIQEAGNRFFCNMIGQGHFTNDWIQAGYKESVMAPDLNDK